MNGVPFAVILGEDEQAQGKVKIKELGVSDDHPEKEGVLISLSDLVVEVRERIRRKADVESVDKMIEAANGLGVEGDSQNVTTGDDGI